MIVQDLEVRHTLVMLVSVQVSTKITLAAEGLGPVQFTKEDINARVFNFGWEMFHCNLYVHLIRIVMNIFLSDTNSILNLRKNA